MTHINKKLYTRSSSSGGDILIFLKHKKPIKKLNSNSNEYFLKPEVLVMTVKVYCMWIPMLFITINWDLLLPSSTAANVITFRDYFTFSHKEKTGI